jgi:hypothetical protein
MYKTGGFVKKIIVVTSILLVVLASCFVKKPKVAVLYSYYLDYKWVIRENKGLMENLDNQKYEINNFYLDSKKDEEKIWLHNTCPDVITQIQEYNPELLIAFDDNALRCLQLYNKTPKYNILFSGINTDPKDYEIEAKIAGVVGTIHLNKSLNLLGNLKIGSENLVLITDNSMTSQHFLEQIPQSEFQEVVQSNDFNLWQQKILGWQNSNIDALCVLLYHNLRDSEGNYLSPASFISWLKEYNRIPEIGFFDFSIDDGLLCGVTTSAFDQAKLVGKLATAYLEKGEFPSQKMQLHPASNPRINIERARELGITVDKIKNWR